MKEIKLNVKQIIDNNNKLVSISFRNSEDQFHNEYGPAFISFYKSGNKEFEYYYLNGVGYNKILYYENGNISEESFHLNNLLHNENGPAKIFYYENEDKVSEFYYLNGKKLFKEEWEKQTQKKNSCNGTIIDVDGVKYKLSIVE